MAPHSRRESLHLDTQDIVALRLDGGNTKAFDSLLNACHQWVRANFSWIPPQANCEKIVGAALLAVMQDLLSPQISPETVRCRLEMALDRQRSMWQKQAKIFTRLAESLRQEPNNHPSLERGLDPEFWLDVVQEIEQYLFPSLLSLNERDRCLLVEAYSLSGMNDPNRIPKAPTFPSAGARRAALSRARAHFRDHLESMLVTALELRQKEQYLLKAALHIVRGNATASALAAVKGLK